MRALIVSVQYSDYLALTLPYNRHHFGEVYVVTSKADAPDLRELCARHEARLVVTDLFYANGAVFNKWAAMEYALDLMDRRGWLCLLDADVAWPQHATESLVRYLRPGFLFTPRRRMLREIPKVLPPEEHWRQYPLHRNEGEFAGYSQIFHASDPHLGQPPWHQTDWLHAGGADSFFQARWPRENKIRPPFECLHLGPEGTNWCGRASPYADGTRPPEAEERFRRLRAFMSQRRTGARTADPYRHERMSPPPPTGDT